MHTEPVKVYLRFNRNNRQFYSPTLKKAFGREQLHELICNGTITEIEYLGSEEEREAAIDFLMYKQQLTLHDKLKERK